MHKVCISAYIHMLYAGTNIFRQIFMNVYVCSVDV